MQKDYYTLWKKWSDGGGESEGVKEQKCGAHERKWNEFKWGGEEEEEVQIKIHEEREWESKMMRLKWKVLNVFTVHMWKAY